MSGKRVNDLTDLTVQGIWEAHLKGELSEADELDRVAVRAAGVLAEKGHWTWMLQAATDELTSWQDLHWNYWAGREIRPPSLPRSPRSTPIATTAGLGFRAVLEPGGGTQVSMVA